MRDANGREIVVGDRVQVIVQRMRNQPMGVVTHMYYGFVRVLGSDIDGGMLPENITVIDDDLTMDEGL